MKRAFYLSAAMVMIAAFYSCQNEETRMAEQKPLTKMHSVGPEKFVIGGVETVQEDEADEQLASFLESMELYSLAGQMDRVNAVPIYTDAVFPNVDLFLQLIEAEWYIHTFHELPEVLFYVYNFPDGGYAIVNANASTQPIVMHLEPIGEPFNAELFYGLNYLFDEYSGDLELLWQDMSDETGANFDYNRLYAWYENYFGSSSAPAYKVKMAFNMLIYSPTLEKIQDFICAADGGSMVVDNALAWTQYTPYNDKCDDGEMPAGTIPVTIAQMCAYTHAEFEYKDRFWRWGDIVYDTEVQDWDALTDFIGYVYDDLKYVIENDDNYVEYILHRYLPEVIGIEVGTVMPNDIDIIISSMYHADELKPFLVVGKGDMRGVFGILIGCKWVVMSDCRRNFTYLIDRHNEHLMESPDGHLTRLLYRDWGELASEFDIYTFW